MGYLPIEDHGVIGDLHTAALVGTDGTIDWLCLPAFDSPSVFCSILDDEKGGHFKLKPLEYARSQQLYLPDTNVLLTRFLSSEGVAEVLDFMPIEPKGEERHQLVRSVRVILGEVTLEAECRPAFDYARREHAVSIGKYGAVFEGPKITLGLATDVPLEEGPDRGALARFTLREGERATFVLEHAEAGARPVEAFLEEELQEHLHETVG
jgi:GH15 family glucan-1,4-alpha-glucosidase